MLTNRKPAAGSTTELRIHTSHLDEDSGPCFNLGGCELVQCKELKETIFALAEEWCFGGNELKVSECCSIPKFHFQSLHLNKDNTK